MLPGFPLDGGRVLRSVIWGLTGSYWRATQIATRLGQLVGGLLVGAGIAWFFLVDFQGLWMAVIGGFLLMAATASYRQERQRENLRGPSGCRRDGDRVGSPARIYSPVLSPGCPVPGRQVRFPGRVGERTNEWHRHPGVLWPAYPRAGGPSLPSRKRCFPGPCCPGCLPTNKSRRRCNAWTRKTWTGCWSVPGGVHLGLLTRRSAARFTRTRRS